MRRSSGDDESPDATHLVAPVDPYEPFPLIDPAVPVAPAEFPAPALPPNRRFGPAVIFGLVGTLVGVIALAVVVTVNCERLGIGLCQDEHRRAATAMLPSVDPSRYLITSNPGLPGGLPADVNQLLGQIPAVNQTRARSFIAGARFLGEHLPSARVDPACGYGTGEPAVRLYQDRAAAWSVGLAVVATGTLVDVFTEGSPCFLGRRIAAMVNLADDGRVDPSFCAARPGAGFTVLMLGSSVEMCAALTRQPTAQIRSVHAPATALRPAPTSLEPPIAQVAAGTTVTAICHEAGWFRVALPPGTQDVQSGQSTVEELTGYMAGADLEVASSPVRPCGEAAAGASAGATFEPASIEVGSCVANLGTAEHPNMRATSCTDPAGYKVLRKLTGPSIPESPGGGFGATTANIACAGTEYDTWYGYDTLDDATDVFLCLKSLP